MDENVIIATIMQERRLNYSPIKLATEHERPRAIGFSDYLQPETRVIFARYLLSLLTGQSYNCSAALCRWIFTVFSKHPQRPIRLIANSEEEKESGGGWGAGESGPRLKLPDAAGFRD